MAFVHALLAAGHLAMAHQIDVRADGQIHGVGLHHNRKTQITWQLVMTGREASLEDLPSSLRANVAKTLALNPGMTARYLSQTQCRMYVRQHCDDELAEFYNAETDDHFRAVICRAAVLLQEGGFYADLDVEPALPFKSLVDKSTKFMSVFTRDGALLNYLMAAVPGSPVLKQTLVEVLKFYKGADRHKGRGSDWIGLATMKRALQSVMQVSCPNLDLDTKRQGPDLQWQCGSHSFRFFREDKLRCGHRELWHAGVATPECPRARMESKTTDTKWGVFTPGDERKIVAWPRPI